MDYADLNVPMLARMFDRRCRGYEAVGYTILLPASAVPGWPAEVPLPVDPQWKTDYAASVRRLVRDGVDMPLANLFVHVTRDGCSHGRGSQSGAQRDRGVPLPPPGDLAGNRGPIPPQCRVADSVRWQRPDGSGSALCRCTRGHRAGRVTTSGRGGSLSPRSAEGPALAGTRLLRAPVPRRGRGPAPRHGARYDPPHAGAPPARLMTVGGQLAHLDRTEAGHPKGASDKPVRVDDPDTHSVCCARETG